MERRTGWLALETGEHEEDRVERVVAENPIETLAVLGAEVSVGWSGIELGHEHGAANAYLGASPAMSTDRKTRHSDDD